VLLLPDQPGAHPHEMLSAGKDGTIYLVDRDNMGHYSTTTNNNLEYRGAWALIPDPWLQVLYIAAVLARHPTLDAAAKALGIDPSTLYRKRERYGLR